MSLAIGNYESIISDRYFFLDKPKKFIELAPEL